MKQYLVIIIGGLFSLFVMNNGHIHYVVLNVGAI